MVEFWLNLLIDQYFNRFLQLDFINFVALQKGTMLKVGQSVPQKIKLAVENGHGHDH